MAWGVASMATDGAVCSFTFAGDGKLGLVFPTAALPLTIARIAADGLAAQQVRDARLLAPWSLQLMEAQSS
eukprot:SAG11_NODE_20636_length_441_cov_1.043860_1_plen_71_part_00